MASPETVAKSDAPGPFRGRSSSRHAGPAGLLPTRLDPMSLGLAAIAVAVVALVALKAPTYVPGVMLVIIAAIFLSFIPKTGVNYLLGFVALLFVIPSTLTVTGPLNGIGQPSTILGWGAGILWVAGRLHIDSGIDRRRNPARWVVLAFFLVVVLAYGVAYTRPLSALEVQGTLRSLVKITSYVGVGLLTMDCLRDRQDIDKLLKGIVIGVTFSAVIGIIQFRTGFNYVEKVHIPGLNVSRGLTKGSVRQGLHRVVGTSHHPIEFAVSLVTALPFALHYATYLGKSRFRTFMRVAAALIAVAVPTAISRTGTVGIILVMVIVAADWSWRRRANIAGLAVLVATVVAVLVPRLLGTLKNLVSSLAGSQNSASINGRTSDYEHVQPYLHGHWLLGRGQGTFQVGQYFTLDNQYLNTLLAEGLLGVTMLLALYFSIILLGRGARKRARDRADRSLGQALVAAGVVLAFSAATFDLFGFTQAVGLTFLMVGIAGAFWRITYFERKAAEAGDMAEKSSPPAHAEAPVPVG